jgi:hypothetical protein
MPSTPSPILRLELQETGEGLNVWGARLNESGFRLVEQAIAGLFQKALTGNYTLSVVNYDEDEARNAMLVFTDGGLASIPTVTIPDVTRLYYVENRGATYAIRFTAGSGMATLPVGRKGFLLCDGANVSIFDSVSDVASFAATAKAAQEGAEAALEAAVGAAQSAAGSAGTASGAAAAAAAALTAINNKFIVSTAAPDNGDGRPNGTIYFKIT